MLIMRNLNLISVQSWTYLTLLVHNQFSDKLKLWNMNTEQQKKKKEG